jgi:hypothetical protein
MRESRTYGSVRGALSNERPYRDSSVSSALDLNSRVAEVTVCGIVVLIAPGYCRSRLQREPFRAKVKLSILTVASSA